MVLPHPLYGTPILILKEGLQDQMGSSDRPRTTNNSLKAWDK